MSEVAYVQSAIPGRIRCLRMFSATVWMPLRGRSPEPSPPTPHRGDLNHYDPYSSVANNRKGFHDIGSRD